MENKCIQNSLLCTVRKVKINAFHINLISILPKKGSKVLTFLDPKSRSAAALILRGSYTPQNSPKIAFFEPIAFILCWKFVSCKFHSICFIQKPVNLSPNYGKMQSKKDILTSVIFEGSKHPKIIQNISFFVLQ